MHANIHKQTGIAILYATMFSVFYNYDLFGIHKISIGPLSTLLIITVLTIATFIYLRDIKLTIYRLLLRTYLNSNSRLMKIIYPGFIVQTLALFISVYVAIHGFTFLATIRFHPAQFAILALFSIAYEFIKHPVPPMAGTVSESLSQLLTKYAPTIIFIAALSTLTLVYTLLFDMPQHVPLNEIAPTAADYIEDTELTYRPARIVVRHLIAAEITVQSMASSLGEHYSIGSIGQMIIVLITTSFGYITCFSFVNKAYSDLFNVLTKTNTINETAQ